ncbi:DJ-1/PfpI family protein [Chitinophaga nivalis]|uniref:DJ-1/PfpI family protein n=1 Tax=Chitinophaga nivalis TaxID=2991709 RepID=A0ABT3IEA9_9BACT|nr:DJ-1/PfpI family protein [Chitinophaga nivalis]MCW3468016.1 DJ-1/PfpI family protein [Chitinophaga nivalis]MCW3482293.1 DJ-1/PfpI family protein [Chitinophaga nivalis]
MRKLKVGMFLFPELTILDFTGPYECFVKASCFEVLVIGETTDPIKAEGGLTVQPNIAMADCPQLDILFVPGGRGINTLLTNQAVLGFLRNQAAGARYITAVCTGSLVLAAAGLLQGYKATTHWRSLDLLEMFGVETVTERIVRDRNRITGGGITAGIDFGLSLIALIGGAEMAKTIQLQLEYAPAPPFNAGSPKTAGIPVLQKVKEDTRFMKETRTKIIRQLLQDQASSLPLS